MFNKIFVIVIVIVIVIISLQIKKSLRHAKMNPYCDDGFLQRFVQEVERFEKTVEGLNKHTLSGHMPLEKDWKVK